MKVFEVCGCGASVESTDGTTGIVPSAVVTMIEEWRTNHRHTEPVALSVEERETPDATAVVNSLADYLAANNILRVGLSLDTVVDAIRVWHGRQPIPLW